MPPAVEITHLTKDFACGLRGLRVRAVDDLSLRVGEGKVHALVGPNGSGKSTTIKALLGLIAPTQGMCRIFGVVSSHVDARASVGYLPDAPEFYRHWTGRELVRFYARICGVGKVGRETAVDRAIRLVDMGAAADRSVGTYSKGMLQRIGLAQAMVHEPRLIILDEPLSGLDFMGLKLVAALLRRLRDEGKSVLFTSHLLPEIESVCDEVTLLNRGRALFTGAMEDCLALEAESAVLTGPLPRPVAEELAVWLGERGYQAAPADATARRFDLIFERLLAGKNGREGGL